jgi:Uma2 family endonuclease
MATSWITWRDTLLMPEDGNRYEAIGGELYVTPAPTVRHQRISANLFLHLSDLLSESGRGLVLYAPVGVEFPDTEEGVQPDIIFISRERMHVVGEDWVRGAPDLVVEILSPSTAERDRTVKRKLYERQGVAQYWVVDPEAESVEVWDFAAGTTQAQEYRDLVPVRVAGAHAGAITLARVFPPKS